MNFLIPPTKTAITLLGNTGIAGLELTAFEVAREMRKVLFATVNMTRWQRSKEFHMQASHSFSLLGKEAHACLSSLNLPTHLLLLMRLLLLMLSPLPMQVHPLVARFRHFLTKI